jgi:tetratricopeptide (TPR) repeat protein
MKTLASTYFLKALDQYPYDLTAFLESINYALSYDENDPDANSLMGRFSMEHLFDFDAAKYYFEKALSDDINHIQTYYNFIRWAIDVNDLELAKKLIKYAKTIPGICQASLLHRRGSITEKNGNYKKALQYYSRAIENTISNSDSDFFKGEKARIKNKMKKK